MESPIRHQSTWCKSPWLLEASSLPKNTSLILSTTRPRPPIQSSSTHSTYIPYTMPSDHVQDSDHEVSSSGEESGSDESGKASRAASVHSEADSSAALEDRKINDDATEENESEIASFIEEWMVDETSGRDTRITNMASGNTNTSRASCAPYPATHGDNGSSWPTQTPMAWSADTHGRGPTQPSPSGHARGSSSPGTSQVRGGGWGGTSAAPSSWTHRGGAHTQSMVPTSQPLGTTSLGASTNPASQLKRPGRQRRPQRGKDFPLRQIEPERLEGGGTRKFEFRGGSEVETCYDSAGNRTGHGSRRNLVPRRSKL